jgi:hypothetical protein
MEGRITWFGLIGPQAPVDSVHSFVNAAASAGAGAFRIRSIEPWRDSHVEFARRIRHICSHTVARAPQRARRRDAPPERACGCIGALAALPEGAAQRADRFNAVDEERMRTSSWFCVFGLAAALLLPLPAAAAADRCVSANERQALDTRVLQTELLIAGLSCGQSERYNAFVTAFQPQLEADGAALKGLFRRLHGRRSEDELNAFVTRLANDSSTRSQKIGYGYCYFTWDLFDEVLATPPSAYAALTDRPWIPTRHGFERCRDS